MLPVLSLLNVTQRLNNSLIKDIRDHMLSLTVPFSGTFILSSFVFLCHHARASMSLCVRVCVEGTLPRHQYL